MTQDEFDKTAFRKGDKVRVFEGTFILEAVDLCESPVFYIDGGCMYELEEILEYIPVEVEGKEKPLTDSTNKHETEGCYKEGERNLIIEQIKELETKNAISKLKANGYRVQKKTEIWEDC